MGKRFEKKIVTLLMTLLIGFAFYPSPVSATDNLGFFSADTYGRTDETSPCQTGYPYIIFDVYKTSGNSGTARIQKYSNGNWIDLSNTTYNFSSHTTIKIASWSSSTLYRVKVQNGYYNVALSGYATCKGSW